MKLVHVELDHYSFVSIFGLNYHYLQLSDISIKQYFIFMANQLIYNNKIKKDTLILVY